MELEYTAVGENEQSPLKEMLKTDASIGRELLAALEDEPHTLMAIYAGNEVVGLVQVVPGEKESFLLVFVAPQQRQKGIGEAALRYGEARLYEMGTKHIRTEYPAASEAARTFARKFGYSKQFSSAFMARVGEKFPAENWPIRTYRAEDYDQGQALYAQAFHEMRVRVGDFPDSVVGWPSEKERKAWDEDRENRFTYERDGEVVGHAHLEGSELSSVSVRSDLQGQGIGKGFVKFLCNEIYDRGYGEVTLWCVIGNHARRLYDHLGFREVYIMEFAQKRFG